MGKGPTFALVLLTLCIEWCHSEKTLDFVCPVVSEEYKNYADPSDCSKFFECHQGEKVSYSCQPGFLFDPVDRHCNFAEEVNCNRTPSPITPTASPDFVCPVVSEEYKNYADPKDCSKYYECHQGEKVSYSCQRGFLFDQVKGFCNFATEVNCNRTQISTTPAPVSPSSPPDFVCPVVSEEYKNYVDPKDCSKYYECHQGEKVSYSCQPGFLFDAVKGLCNFASEVNCNRTQVSTTPAPVSPTSSPDFVCPIVSEEYKNYPDPKDCSKYYECHQGEIVSYSCQPGFLFDAVKGFCNFAPEVNCNRSQISTTPAPVSPTSPPDFVCPIVSEEYKNYPDPKDCSKYYECHQGDIVSYSCQPGFLFDAIKGFCNFASEVNCNITRTSTTPSPVLPTSSPDISCSVISDEYIRFADPTNCSRYYECHLGEILLLSCSPGFFFDPVNKQCDFDFNVNCTITTVSTIEPTTQNWRTTPKYIFVCPIVSSKVTTYADPFICSKYYTCLNGIKEEMVCVPGFVWNDKTEDCDFPENVDCNARSTIPTFTTPQSTDRTQPSVPTRNPTTQVTDTTTPSDNICENKPDGTYLADPNNCRRFFECSGGKTYVFTCSPGSIWSQADKSCVNSKTDC